MSTFSAPCPSTELSSGRRWLAGEAKLALSKACMSSQSSGGPRGHLRDALSPAALRTQGLAPLPLQAASQGLAEMWAAVFTV